MTPLENNKSPVYISFLPYSWLVSEMPTNQEMHCDIRLDICYNISESGLPAEFRFRYVAAESQISEVLRLLLRPAVFLQSAESEDSGTRLSL